jgi:hypothetical protein
MWLGFGTDNGSNPVLVREAGKLKMNPEMNYGNAHEALWKRARRTALERKLHGTRPRTGEYAAIDSYAQRVDRQRALAGWLWDQEFDLHITINSNDPRLGYGHGRDALKKFDALVDRYFLGKKWCRFDSNNRTLFFAVPEHGGGELHYHILMKLRPKARRDRKKLRRFIRLLTGLLKSKKIFPRGDAHVHRLTGRSEIEECDRQLLTACYVAKGLWREDDFSHCVLSSELHSGHRVT